MSSEHLAAYCTIDCELFISRYGETFDLQKHPQVEYFDHCQIKTSYHLTAQLQCATFLQHPVTRMPTYQMLQECRCFLLQLTIVLCLNRPQSSDTSRMFVQEFLQLLIARVRTMPWSQSNCRSFFEFCPLISSNNILIFASHSACMLIVMNLDAAQSVRPYS